jgi:hypothetical protein
MSIPVTAERIAPNAIRYEWTGTAPYVVWERGSVVLNESSLTEYVAQNLDGTTNPLPAIEVLDSTDTVAAQNQNYSPRVRMQWRGQADAELYLIQEYVDSTWTTRDAVIESGAGYYGYETDPYDHGDAPQWRILPQDSGQYQGTPISFTFNIVCNPLPPAVAYTYDSGTGLTVSAV